MWRQSLQEEMKISQSPFSSLERIGLSSEKDDAEQEMHHYKTLHDTVDDMANGHLYETIHFLQCGSQVFAFLEQ